MYQIHHTLVVSVIIPSCKYLLQIPPVRADLLDMWYVCGSVQVCVWFGVYVYMFQVFGYAVERHVCACYRRSHVPLSYHS